MILYPFKPEVRSPKSKVRSLKSLSGFRIYQIKYLFLRRRENRSTPGKNLPEQQRSEPIQPTRDAESGNRTQATLVGGECSHHDATTALNSVCYVWLSILTVLSVQRVTGATKSKLKNSQKITVSSKLKNFC